MGKVKKIKRKLGLDAPKNDTTVLPSKNQSFGISFNFEDLKKDKFDDVKSVLSYKSVKSRNPVYKTIKKKDKLNLKRKLLKNKIDVVNNMKKEAKIKKKRKNISLIGDTNPLHDALPTLESLLKNKSDINYKLPKEPKKKKGIATARQRKKKVISDMDLFKKTIKNKMFKNNPFEVISNHIQAVVQEERKQIK